MRLTIKIIFLCILAAAFTSIAILVSNHNATVIVFDQSIATFANTLHSPFLDRAVLAITQVDNPYQSLCIFLVLALFLIAKKKKYALYIFTVALSLAITLAAAIKIIVARPRPIMHLLYQSGFSFPSEHATMSAVYLISAILLIAPLIQNQFVRTLWLMISMIVFPLVALSRIYLSVHFASDVAAGILLGSAAYLFANIVVLHHESTLQDTER